MKPRLEKFEQRDIVATLTQIGATVYVLGTRRKRTDHQGTMQTPGVPDVLAFLPARGERSSRLVAIEVKRSARGVVSAAQRQFAECCGALRRGAHLRGFSGRHSLAGEGGLRP